MIVKIYLTFLLGAFEKIYKRWIEKGRRIQLKTSQTQFLQLKHFCTVHSVQTERKKKSFTPQVTKQRVKVPITGDKLVVHFSSLPLVFLYTISLKLDRILLSLFLLSSWLNDARARFSSALQIWFSFLRRTASIRRCLRGEKFVSITGRKAEHASGSAQLNPAQSTS